MSLEGAVTELLQIVNIRRHLTHLEEIDRRIVEHWIKHRERSLREWLQSQRHRDELFPESGSWMEVRFPLASRP